MKYYEEYHRLLSNTPIENREENQKGYGKLLSATPDLNQKSAFELLKFLQDDQLFFYKLKEHQHQLLSKIGNAEYDFY